MKKFVITIGLIGALTAWASATVSKSKISPVPSTPDEKIVSITTPQNNSSQQFKIQSHHFTVIAPNIILAKQVADEAEASLQRICDELFPGKADMILQAEINLWANEKLYRIHAPQAPLNSGGLFTPSKGNPDNQRHRIDLYLMTNQVSDPNVLTEKILTNILPHEIFHLVLWEYFQTSSAPDKPWPAAIHEGLAMLAEKTVDKTRLLLAGASLACEPNQSPGNDLPLERLLLAKPFDKSTNAAVFYAQSYSFAGFLLDKLNSLQYINFLAQLHSGQDINHALQDVLDQKDDPAFMVKLSNDWQKHAILQAQIIRALQLYENDNPLPGQNLTLKQNPPKI